MDEIMNKQIKFPNSLFEFVWMSYIFFLTFTIPGAMIEFESLIHLDHFVKQKTTGQNRWLITGLINQSEAQTKFTISQIQILFWQQVEGYTWHTQVNRLMLLTWIKIKANFDGQSEHKWSMLFMIKYYEVKPHKLTWFSSASDKNPNP